MSEVLISELSQVTCPTWCTNPAGGEGHPHVSGDVHVETLGQPLTARLVQMAADSAPRVLINGQVATLEQAATFARSVRRLTDEGVPAQVDVSFVFRLADRSGTTLEELALAAGIDVERVRQQKLGQFVLTVAETDRLAMAVARIATSA